MSDSRTDARVPEPAPDALTPPARVFNDALTAELGREYRSHANRTLWRALVLFRRARREVTRFLGRHEDGCACCWCVAHPDAAADARSDLYSLRRVLQIVGGLSEGEVISPRRARAWGLLGAGAAGKPAGQPPGDGGDADEPVTTEPTTPDRRATRG
jgi:hypothetical protein